MLATNFAVFVAEAIAFRVWPEFTTRLAWGITDWGPFTLGGQWWRLLTSTFLHRDLGHLLGNLLFLWILGRRAEQIFGKRTFLLFYLSCGLLGSITSVAVHPEIMSCGASAGIFGLAGGLISAYCLQGLKISNRALWRLALLILWTAYSVYPDAQRSDIDNVAHAGGLLTGLALGAMLASRFAGTTERRRSLFAWVTVLLVLGFASIRYYHGYVVPLKLAVRALNNRQPDQALVAINVALQKNPDSMLANVLAAEANLGKEDYPNAEAAVRHALAIDRDDDHATYLLGLVKLHTGHCNEAHDIGESTLGSQVPPQSVPRKSNG